MKPESTNAATRRSHRIVELLAGRFFDGMTNKDLAAAVGTSAVNMCRDLATLENLGYVRKLENGCWGLTTKPLIIMKRYANHYESLQERMAETNRNIFAGANNQ